MRGAVQAPPPEHDSLERPPPSLNRQDCLIGEELDHMLRSSVTKLVATNTVKHVIPKPPSTPVSLDYTSDVQRKNSLMGLSSQPMVHIHVQFRGKNIQVPYNPHDCFTDFTSKVLSSLQEPENAKIELEIEPTIVTPENFTIYNHQGAGWVVKFASPMPPFDPPLAPPTDLTIINSVSKLFEQKHGTDVMIMRNGYSNRMGFVSCKQPDDLLNVLQKRIPTITEFSDEGWRYSDGTKALSIRPNYDETPIFLEIGYAFGEKPEENILVFCLVQQLEDNKEVTPAYRVKNFTDSEQAAQSLVSDAQRGISTIGSYWKSARILEVCGSTTDICISSDL
ncbi:MAG: hypothetical protein M1821_004667 [Bathelium mastoideum]|nr:MAG: hypothetical protein M1821_004667 [Bathelium mastoideum]